LIFGISQEIYRLALDHKDSSQTHCQAASNNIINLNLTIDITKEVYGIMAKAIADIARMRTGFFCVLCDAKSQSKLSEFWNSNNFMNRNTIYYNKDFCSQLVEEQIRMSYYQVFYLKPLIDNMVTLVNCTLKEDHSLIYEVDPQIHQQVKNCYFMRNNFFFYFCEKYCENFHLTKPTILFDGDIKQLKTVVDFVVDQGGRAFHYAANNILTDGLSYEVTALAINEEFLRLEDGFFKPVSQENLLDE
jgi:hypothetical protein